MRCPFPPHSSQTQVVSYSSGIGSSHKAHARFVSSLVFLALLGIHMVAGATAGRAWEFEENVHAVMYTYTINSVIVISFVVIFIDIVVHYLFSMVTGATVMPRANATTAKGASSAHAPAP